jgi:ribonuclease Y
VSDLCTDPDCVYANIRSHSHMTREESQARARRFDLPGGESTAAALRRAEQERDRALAEVSGVRASLAELADEVDDLKATLAMRTGQLMASRRHVQQADAERDLARAELASARQELDAIRREAGAT